MKSFQCKRCGFCCQGESTVSLSEEEVLRIADFLHISKDVFLKNYAKIVCKGRIEMKTVNGFCIFFDQEKRLCRIHPVKPDRCKEWPFPRAIFTDEENFHIIKNSCLGLENFSFEDIKFLKNLTK